MQKIVLILHNIRSTYNVGSITRTAECLGVDKIYATGYTPYTFSEEKIDPPHVALKMRTAIHKTALSAEEVLPINKHSDVTALIADLKDSGYSIVALEQSPNSLPINQYEYDKPVALILGEEVHGITNDLLNLSDTILEIPMLGKKESFNVSVATAITLYELRRKIFTVQ